MKQYNLDFDVVAAEGPIEDYRRSILAAIRLWPLQKLPPINYRARVGDCTVTIRTDSEPIQYDGKMGLPARGEVENSSGIRVVLFTGVITGLPVLSPLAGVRAILPPVVPAENGDAFGAN